MKTKFELQKDCVQLASFIDLLVQAIQTNNKALENKGLGEYSIPLNSKKDLEDIKLVYTILSKVKDSEEE